MNNNKTGLCYRPVSHKQKSNEIFSYDLKTCTDSETMKQVTSVFSASVSAPWDTYSESDWTQMMNVVNNCPLKQSVTDSPKNSSSLNVTLHNRERRLILIDETGLQD